MILVIVVIIPQRLLLRLAKFVQAHVSYALPLEHAPIAKMVTISVLALVSHVQPTAFLAQCLAQRLAHYCAIFATMAIIFLMMADVMPVLLNASYVLRQRVLSAAKATQ